MKSDFGRDAGSAPIPLEPPLARPYALAFCAVRCLVGARVLVRSKRTRGLEEGRPHLRLALREARVEGCVGVIVWCGCVLVVLTEALDEGR